MLVFTLKLTAHGSAAPVAPVWLMALLALLLLDLAS